MLGGTRVKGKEFAKFIKNLLDQAKGFEKLMLKVPVTDGGDGKCTAEFTVEPQHLNRGGYLHGGFTATVVDMVTTYALMSKPSHAGLSVDLHVTYLKGAKEGDVVVVNANTIRAGRQLAFIECELRHKNDGSVIAKGSQTKFVAMGN